MNPSPGKSMLLDMPRNEAELLIVEEFCEWAAYARIAFEATPLAAHDAAKRADQMIGEYRHRQREMIARLADVRGGVE